MRARHRVWAGWGIVGLSCFGILTACAVDNTLTTNGGIIGPGTTSVSVDPDTFLGSVACSNRPGSMRSYVATLTDQSLPGPGGLTSDGDGGLTPGEGGTGFVLPSSPPTDCSQSVYFEYVIVGDGFSAEVDGYDEPPENLAPACSFQGLTAPPAGPDGGASATCSTDGDCLPIYGCGGACIVSPDPNDMNPEPLRGQPCSAAADAGTMVKCLCNYTAANGGRQMYYPLSFADHDGKAHNQLAVPRWTTCTATPCTRASAPQDKPCGYGPPPRARCECPAGTLCGLDLACYPESQAFTNVSIGPCPTLYDDQAMPDAGPGDGGQPSAIQVIPGAALGSLACASDGGAGTVTLFDIVPTDPGLSPVTGVACDPSAPVVFSQGVVWGRSYVLTLNAYVAGQTSPAYTSQCFATAQLGMTVTAMCDPLALPPDGG